MHNWLHNITKGAMTIDEYIKKIRIMNDKLSTIGQVINKSMFIFTFIRGLLLEYTPFIARLIIRLKNPSLEDTII